MASHHSIAGSHELVGPSGLFHVRVHLLSGLTAVLDAEIPGAVGWTGLVWPVGAAGCMVPWGCHELEQLHAAISCPLHRGWLGAFPGLGVGNPNKGFCLDQVGPKKER